MSVGKGIAIAGIWLGVGGATVGMEAFQDFGAVTVGIVGFIAAVIATIRVTS